MNRLTPEQHALLQKIAADAKRKGGPGSRKTAQALQAAGDEIWRLRRALDAGVRRYADRREVQELEQSRVESAAMDLAVELVETQQRLEAAGRVNKELQQSLRSLLSRNSKLEGKLVTRAAALGAERGVMAAVLDAKTKEAAGLRASLAKQRGRTAEAKADAAMARRGFNTQVQLNTALRKKLRDSNKAVLVGQLGGGLEVSPVTGRPFEDTSGYTPAAREAAGVNPYTERKAEAQRAAAARWGAQVRGQQEGQL